MSNICPCIVYKRHFLSRLRRAWRYFITARAQERRAGRQARNPGATGNSCRAFPHHPTVDYSVTSRVIASGRPDRNGTCRPPGISRVGKTGEPAGRHLRPAAPRSCQRQDSDARSAQRNRQGRGRRNPCNGGKQSPASSPDAQVDLFIETAVNYLPGSMK